MTGACVCMCYCCCCFADPREQFYRVTICLFDTVAQLGATVDVQYAAHSLQEFFVHHPVCTGTKCWFAPPVRSARAHLTRSCACVPGLFLQHLFFRLLPLKHWNTLWIVWLPPSWMHNPVVVVSGVEHCKAVWFETVVLWSDWWRNCVTLRSRVPRASGRMSKVSGFALCVVVCFRVLVCCVLVRSSCVCVCVCVCVLCASAHVYWFMRLFNGLRLFTCVYSTHTLLKLQA
jgi:hypothetical protein